MGGIGSISFRSIPMKYRNVIVLALGTLAVTLGISVFDQALFPYLLLVFGTYELAYGYGDPSIYLLAMIAAAAILPVMGWLSDTYGRKIFIVVAFFTYSLMAFLYPTTVVFPLMYFIFITSLLSSMYTPAYNALLADSVESHRRGLAFGMTSGILYIGSLAAPVVASASFSAWGFLGVFSTSAVVMLSGAVLCLLLLAKPVDPQAIKGSRLGDYGSRRENAGARDLEEASGKEDAKSINSVLKLRKSSWRKVIISLIAIRILFSYISMPMSMVFSYIFLGYYWLGIDFIQAIELWLAFLGLFSLVLGGVLADRRGRKRTLQDILKLSIVFSLVISLGLVASYLWSFVALMSMVTFVGSALSPVTSALVSDITPSSRRGLTYGSLILGVGVGAFPLIALVAVLLPLMLGLSGILILFALVFVSIAIATILSILGVEEPEAVF